MPGATDTQSVSRDPLEQSDAIRLPVDSPVGSRARTRPIRVLFVMDNPGFLRYFDETVVHLLRRGHQVSLAFNTPHYRADALVTLPSEAGLSVIGQAPPRRDRFAVVARRVRLAMDYARYLEPRFARAQFYRNKRRYNALGTGIRAGLALRTVRKPWVDGAVKVLGALEDAIPSSREVEGFIRDAGPDVVVVTPLVLDASPQTDYVKSARALGLPTALCVASWDNLTNKGLMRVVPDSVVVWNGAQLEEAVDMHGVDRSRVTVTGAQNFDRWFGRRPSTDPDEFRLKVGLPPRQPFVLYVGSTSNIARAGVEEDFVRRWLEALRGSDDPAVAGVPVLVRPHPERPGTWYDGPVGPGEVALWPPEAPEDITNVTDEARRDYFDSLHHSAAVVGINTSAMLEAAILGRPVLSVRSPELSQAHEGTLHFDYLLPENGGFLQVAADFVEHVGHLSEVLHAPELGQARSSGFVRRFVRPNGIERPCTPLLADAIERLAQTEPHPVATSAAARYPLRLLLELYVRTEHRRRAGGPRSGTAKRRARAVKRLARAVRPHSKSLARVLKGAAVAIERSDERRRARAKPRLKARADAKRFGQQLLNPQGRTDHVPARYAGRDLSD